MDAELLQTVGTRPGGRQRGCAEARSKSLSNCRYLWPRTSNLWLESTPNSAEDPRGWKSRRERWCPRPSPCNYCGYRASKSSLPARQLSGYLLEFRAHHYREGRAEGQQQHVWSELGTTLPVHSRAQLTAVERQEKLALN